MSSGNALHYDTDLYHSQMIRWIEEYGAVKGLGNLHNRFAYNSVFFCLQALYSLKFIAGQSLHSVNGLVTVIFSMYAVCTLSVWKGKKLQVSDFIKLGLLVYYSGIEPMAVLSPPSSDTLTLSLVLYLMSKWAELTEKKTEDPTEYGLLCLLAVWALTLKLSAGLLVLLTIYPAVRFLKQRQWRVILLFILGGVIILFPFLARNVITSGYLVYPYASIDLFNVDWKMPASVAESDKLEIIAWGSVYLLLLPAVCLGTICSSFSWHKGIWFFLVGLVAANSFLAMLRYSTSIAAPVKRPADYAYRDHYEIIWEGTTVYIPQGSDCIGYHYFPSAPSEYRLIAVELRGESLAEGFRIKEEYRDAAFSTYGPCR